MRGSFTAEHALIALNLVDPDASGLEFGVDKTVSDPKFPWLDFIQLGELNDVVPLTYSRLVTRNLLPKDASPTVAAALAQWQRRSVETQAAGVLRYVHLRRILAALEARGCDVILLKGALLGPVLYGDPGYKRMNDVDLLIREGDADKALAAVRAEGFTSFANPFGDAGRREKTHHAPPLYNDDQSCVVGLHWGLTGKAAPWRPDVAGIWRRSEPLALEFPLAGRRMAWEDTLLHLCIHLPFLKTGLRELADVVNTALYARPKIDWSQFAERVKEWRAEDAAFRVLTLANALNPVGVPATDLAKWESLASGLTRRDTRTRAILPILMRTRSAQAARIEKASVVQRLSYDSGRGLLAFFVMWKFFLWPKAEEVRRIACERRRAPWWMLIARTKAPALLWHALARDHGQISLMLLAVSNVTLLLRGLIRCAIPGLRPHQMPEAGRRVIEALE